MIFTVEIDGHARQVEIDRADTDNAEPGSSQGLWRICLDGEQVDADAHLLRPGVLSLLIAGHAYRIVLDADPSAPALHIGPQRIPYRIEDPRSLRSRRRHAGTEGPVSLKASMPGRIVRVLVQKGDPVAAHQGVLVVEAMKMQNELASPKEGRVAEIRVAPGDAVAVGDILAIIE